MFDKESFSTAFLKLSTAVGLGYSIIWLMRQRQLKKFEKIGTVKELVVYPVKSCKGVYVNEAECTQFGLRVNGVGDRWWMLVRGNNSYVSMKTEPKLALVATTITDTGVVLDAPGMDSLTLAKVPHKNAIVRHCSKVAGTSTVEGKDCGDEAAAWVTSFLGTPGLRIVQYSPDLARRQFASEIIGTIWDMETAANESDLSVFADWSTCSLATEASLGALNKDLPAPVTMATFRANIIVSGSKAYDEDNWTNVRIGEGIQLRCVSNSPRCILTTVDLDKGARRANGEPLKTLKRIRPSPVKKDWGMFGVFLAPDVCGVVKVGDPVYALRESTPM